jgi:hypothetical protein
MKPLSEWLARARRTLFFGKAPARFGLAALEESFNAAREIRNPADALTAVKSVHYVTRDALFLDKLQPSNTSVLRRSLLAAAVIVGLICAAPASALVAAGLVVTGVGLGVALVRNENRSKRICGLLTGLANETSRLQGKMTPGMIRNMSPASDFDKKYPDFSLAFNAAVDVIKPVRMEDRIRILKASRRLGPAPFSTAA